MVAAIGAVAGVAGAAISSSAAGDAADAQSGASREATLAQQQAQAQMRQDLSPWVESGRGANSLLNRYLGIGGAGSGRVTSNGLQTGLTPDQVRQQLLSRYTTSNSGANAPGAPKFDINSLPMMERLQYERIKSNPAARAEFEAAHLGQPTSVRDLSGANTGVQGDVMQWQQAPGATSSVDENALNAAIQQYYAEQEELNRAAEADPNYGSLLRAYRDGAEFDSGPAYDAGPAFDRGADFSFTGKDLASEPGYQFGLNQGTQGIERGQAARGNFLSGAAMKELTRFNEDYAGTKFGDAFNRAYNTHNTNFTGRLNEYNTNQATNLNEYNTNLNRRQNEWNTNLGAYNDNRNRIFNFLNGVSTLGQNSAAQTGAGAMQVANNVSNNALSAGNAQAAASIASGNALQSGLNTAANSLRQPQATGINSPSGWNMLLANQSDDQIGSLNSQMGWTG